MEKPPPQVATQATADGQQLSLMVLQEGQPLGFRQVCSLWRESPSFAEEFSAAVAGTPYRAVRLECAAVTRGTFDRAFECLLLPDDFLDREPDPLPFADVFLTHPERDVIRFENLSGDCLLIAPRPDPAGVGYAHLAAFCREAGSDLLHAFWRQVAIGMAGRVGPRKTWLNTAGDGVAWLHLRLDDSPKYYRSQLREE